MHLDCTRIELSRTSFSARGPRFSVVLRSLRGGSVGSVDDFRSHDFDDIRRAIIKVRKLGGDGIVHLFNLGRRPLRHLSAASSLGLRHVFNTHGLRTVRTTATSGGGLQRGASCGLGQFTPVKLIKQPKRR